MQQTTEQPRVLIQHVVIATCSVCMISEEALLSQTRHQSVVYPRQLGMALAKALTDRSLPEIGRRFGNKDHTTVLHAIKRVSGLLEGHRGTQELYAAIEAVACRLAGVRVGEARAVLKPAVVAALQEEPPPPPVVVARSAGRSPAPNPHIDEMRKLRRKGWSVNGLAKRYGMDVDDVCRALGEPSIKVAA
jgi:hypothetical protein